MQVGNWLRDILELNGVTKVAFCFIWGLKVRLQALMGRRDLLTMVLYVEATCATRMKIYSKWESMSLGISRTLCSKQIAQYSHQHRNV
jgi:hypothetical protein